MTQFNQVTEQNLTVDEVVKHIDHVSIECLKATLVEFHREMGTEGLHDLIAEEVSDNTGTVGVLATINEHGSFHGTITERNTVQHVLSNLDDEGFASVFDIALSERSNEAFAELLLTIPNIAIEYGLERILAVGKIKLLDLIDEFGDEDIVSKARYFEDAARAWARIQYEPVLTSIIQKLTELDEYTANSSLVKDSCESMREAIANEL